MTAHIHPAHAAASSGAVLLGNPAASAAAGEPQQRRFDPYSVSVMISLYIYTYIDSFL